MKAVISIFCYFLYTSVINAQYNGNGFDGLTVTTLSKMQITDSLAFLGSSYDGVASIVLSKVNITDDVVFKGSFGDGIALFDLGYKTITDSFAFKGISADGSTSLLLSKSNIEDTMSAKGYNGDGVVSLFLTKSPIEDSLAFRGSIADGHTITIIPKLNITDDLAFRGQMGRGDHHFELKKPDCLSEILLWTGYISQAWENPDNWQCGVVPNVSSEVVILPSALLFPQVNFDDEIKKLVLFPTTSFFINNNVNFKINGQ
jgi:hypothetical protein